jgi:sugar/nucleoside kinase (ribokinase family)
MAWGFGADAVLLTAAGDDEEGNRVREELSSVDKVDKRNHCITVPGGTATRFRFFEFDDNNLAYTLKYICPTRASDQ